ncbi:MAG: MmgE/PrpD family protein [Mesorhizobium sp.]
MVSGTGQADENAGLDDAVTSVLARYALGDVAHHLTAEAARQAADTLLDAVGVALAARNSELVKVFARTHPGLDSGTSTIWSSGSPASAETAAMVNGATVHALDYDDTNESIRGHLAATIWPVLLALGEQIGARGRAMSEAYVVGVRTAVAVADGMVIDDHYAHGWHSTSTIGVVAATCAAARLLGLTLAQTRHALGLAGSMASGSRQNFGTMTKPFHAGLAARNAVLAANLAQAGFTADPSMLEGRLGYYALFYGRDHLARVARSLGDDWTPSRHGVSLKNYAVCYNLHRMCEAMANLKARTDIQPGDIARIDVAIEPQGRAPLIQRAPIAPLECKFSAEYVLAALLSGRTLGPADFADGILENEALLALMARIEVSECPVPPVGMLEWHEGFAVVSVELHSGDVLSERVDNPKGHWGAPFSPEDISRKFRDCVAFGFPGADAAALEQEVRDVAQTDRFAGFSCLPSLAPH